MGVGSAGLPMVVTWGPYRSRPLGAYGCTRYGHPCRDSGGARYYAPHTTPCPPPAPGWRPAAGVGAPGTAVRGFAIVIAQKWSLSNLRDTGWTPCPCLPSPLTT